MKYKDSRTRGNSTNRTIIVVILLAIVAIFGAMSLMILPNKPDTSYESVSGLTLEQTRYKLNIGWDDMDCKGFDVIIICEGKTTLIPNFQDTSYTLNNISPNKTYKVSVSARLDSGFNSRKTTEKIVTHKLRQKMDINMDSLEGLEGDKYQIEAKGDSKGDIIYESGDEKIAKVNNKGQVTLIDSGRTTIDVTAPQDGIYDNTTKTIDVDVYPDSLKRPTKVKVSYRSNSRAMIKWNPVDFATEYVLLKKNAATGKFQEKARVKDGKSEIEITRARGIYAVRAEANIKRKNNVSEITDGHAGENGKADEKSGDEDIISSVSQSSEPVEVKGAGEEAKSYGSNKIIKTLNKSNLEVVRQINGEGSTNIPQSLSMTDNHYVVSYVDRGGSSGKLISYDKSGDFAAMSSAGGIGHANGTTYNPNTNKFYVVKTHKSTMSKSCSTFDGDTKDSTGTFNLPKYTSGIAYDESNNKYYLSKGNQVFVCNDDFEIEKTIFKSIRYNHAQDIGAYNGVVLVCTWVNGSESYVDMYRVSDNKYLGSYSVPIGEIESVVVDDGYLVILMNVIGTSKDYIYKTKDRISLP